MVARMDSRGSESFLEFEFCLVSELLEVWSRPMSEFRLEYELLLVSGSLLVEFESCLALESCFKSEFCLDNESLLELRSSPLAKSLLEAISVLAAPLRDNCRGPGSREGSEIGEGVRTKGTSLTFSLFKMDLTIC
jgi:hypothetical protein